MADIDVTNKRILLVGCTGVLGRQYAKKLSEMGARLVLADRLESDVTELSRELKAKLVLLDVNEESSVVSSVADAAEKYGGLDAVVNNAAATSEGLQSLGDPFPDFEDYPLILWNETIKTNLTGTFLVARESGRFLRQTRGSLVNVSSIYGIVGPDHSIYEGQSFRSFPGYSASKAGVLGLTRWLATWWGKDGVRVNCITPGGVFNDHNEEFAENYGRRTPMGRMADRSELEGILLFLLSDASSYCTGQNYIVDGGYSAW